MKMKENEIKNEIKRIKEKKWTKKTECRDVYIRYRHGMNYPGSIGCDCGEDGCTGYQFSQECEDCDPEGMYSHTQQRDYWVDEQGDFFLKSPESQIADLQWELPMDRPRVFLKMDALKEKTND
jgi:hypothetical protein